MPHRQDADGSAAESNGLGSLNKAILAGIATIVSFMVGMVLLDTYKGAQLGAADHPRVDRIELKQDVMDKKLDLLLWNAGIDPKRAKKGASNVESEP